MRTELRDRYRLIIGVLCMMVGVLLIMLIGPKLVPAKSNVVVPETVKLVLDGSIKAEKTANLVQTHSGATLITAAEWQAKYPEIYASYAANSENDQVQDYVRDYPMIQTLFKGYGFAKSYGSARGHTFVVEDVTSTGRPHKMANCFTCKTPMLSHAVNEQGVEIYSMPFEDFQNDILAQTNEVLSCYNCHANTPGEITVTHTYLADALGEDFSRVDAANLACGQCHVDYYFDPASKAVTLPYTNLSTMSPDAMLDYYNNLIVDGQVFADYVQEDSGVRQIMINHPELETYLGEGSVHKGMFTCADCHMGTVVTIKGEVYPSHFLQSPLTNEELMKNTCSQCHSDLKAEVAAIQKEAEELTYEIGYKLEALINRITEAANSGAYSVEELDTIRMTFRNAQFYWNFVFVENSEGAHNSALTRDCLDKSETLIAECEALFK